MVNGVNYYDKERTGEFIEEWEKHEEICSECGDDAVKQRRWRRHSNGEERILIKCFNCQDSSWVDG